MYPFIQRFAEGGDASSAGAPTSFNTAAADVATTLGLNSSTGLNPFQVASQQVASTYNLPDLTPTVPVNTASNGIANLPAAQQAAPTYANDFERKYAQNVGGQFKDPYQNFLMMSGASTDFDDLLNKYKEAGHTDTPDWAAAKGNVNALPPMFTKWDASGANPVDYMHAYNRTAPTTDSAPEGYWDAIDAYNTGLSQWNPQLAISKNTYDPAQFADYNAAAYHAMKQGVYDRNSPVYQNYVKPQQGGAVGEAQVGILQRQYAQYLRDHASQNPDAFAGQNAVGMSSGGFAQGGLANLRRKY